MLGAVVTGTGLVGVAGPPILSSLQPRLACPPAVPCQADSRVQGEGGQGLALQQLPRAQVDEGLNDMGGAGPGEGDATHRSHKGFCLQEPGKASWEGGP